MANDKSFKIKNGLSVGTRYLQTGGTETAGSVGYDISGASYDSVSFSVSTQQATPLGLAFKPDGTKMYVIGSTGDTAYQYSLSTAFDLSTASYDSVSLGVGSQDTSPMAIVFNGDGTKMYVLGSANASVYQYSLSTGFDLSTASYDSVSFSVSSQDTAPYGIAFNNNGTKMYVVGAGTSSVYQYSLSTAFDLSTTSYDSVSFSFSTQNTSTTDVTFNADGTKLFLSGASSGDSIYQYGLSTPYDISTMSYDNTSFYVGTQSGDPSSIVFNNLGTKMYVLDSSNDTVFQYSTVAYTQTLDLSTGSYFSFTPSGATTVSFTNAPASGKAVGFAVEVNGDGSAITWPTSVKWPSGTAPTATASKEVYAFVTTDGGTSYYGKLAGSDIA